jgi:hypothetical protein
MKVQSVGMKKPEWDSKFRRETWLRNHGFKTTFGSKGVDETETSYRYRQRDPSEFKSYTTKVLNNGVFLVLGNI